jgi:ABC-type sugar transport system ATPase subunit
MRLRLHGISKTFGGTRALRGVHLELEAGEIHALIGENGAGKSTLMKIISGVYPPDEGTLSLDGQPFVPANPLQARRAGVSMIYQELTLAPDLNAEENILLGAEPHVAGWISKSKRRAMARAALTELHSQHIPLNIPARALPIAQQQMVEIARAIVKLEAEHAGKRQDAASTLRVLIMDEPTSSLTQVDTRNLFAVIRKLARRGVSIIYISHFLEESSELCDRYTILRDGEHVATGRMADLDRATTIRLMVGREIEDIYPRTKHKIGAPVLEVRGLRGKHKPRGVDFTLRAGEIFGLAGLVGAGRTETLRTIFGLDRVAAGTVAIVSRPAARATPADRWRDGAGFVSENRKEEGLMLARTIADNLTLTHLWDFGRCGFIFPAHQKEVARGWMEQLQVRAQGPEQAIVELSGGNQQKIAIGRLLHHGADILLLDEPTRGIDVGSKAQIYQLIGRLAAEGKAIVFVSSYLPELLGICDTIGVMCRGALVETRPADKWTEHEIIDAAVGQKVEAAGGEGAVKEGAQQPAEGEAREGNDEGRRRNGSER